MFGKANLFAPHNWKMILAAVIILTATAGVIWLPRNHTVPSQPTSTGPATTAVSPAVYYPGPVYYSNEVVVLMYHDISAGPKPGDVISPQTFAAELALFQKNNFNVITDQQLIGFLTKKEPVPPNAVMITFDNGYESFYRIAYPLLRRYHDPATLFVIVSWLNPPLQHGIFDSLTWGQVKEMYKSGLISIQSQTYDLHQGVAVGPGATSPESVGLIWDPATGTRESLSHYRARVFADVATARQELQTQLGEPDVNFLCYPFGDYTPAFQQVLHEVGYRYLFTAKQGWAILPTTSPDTLFRLNAGFPAVTPEGLVDTIIGVARQTARDPGWKPPDSFVEVWHQGQKPAKFPGHTSNTTSAAQRLSPHIPSLTSGPGSQNPPSSIPGASKP